MAEADEEVDCFICTEPILFHAVGSCNHRVCHVCSLRLRALYKSRLCAYCKRNLANVTFTKDGKKLYKEFAKPTGRDKRLGIDFDAVDVEEDTISLLRFNCPKPDCDVICDAGWKELKQHVREAHNLVMCPTCIRFKKVFTHEHLLYPPHQLSKHTKGSLGPPDDVGFPGHKECGFCKVVFYGGDELWEHCRMRHEECFVCKRLGNPDQWYNDYTSLVRGNFFGLVADQVAGAAL